jgi:hypothetical protein
MAHGVIHRGDGDMSKERYKAGWMLAWRLGGLETTGRDV